MAEDDLEKMTAVELRELALQQYPDITGVHAMKKEELVAAIHQARGEVVKEQKKKKKGGPPTKVEKKDLKKRIRRLKTDRDKFLQGKDHKALARVRKKIKRLKRMAKRAA